MDVTLKGPGAIEKGEIELMSIPVAAGAEFTATVEPQRPYRPHGFALERPELWRILDVRVGAVSQLPDGGPDGIPAQVFGKGVRLDLDTCALGMHLTIRGRNISDATAVLAGKWFGAALEL